MAVDGGAPAGGAGRGRRGTGPLLLLCMAQFMLILDVAIVNVALPSVQRDLGFASGDLQLVMTAYALFFGGLLLLGGRAADLFGRRRVFVWGLGVFTLASLLCGLAPTAGVLVAARALQGAGAALVAPAGLSLLTTIFPEGEERNRALGAWSAVAAGGGAAGLILGGVLTELAGWRWVFLVNAPVGTAVVAASLRALPEGSSVERAGGERTGRTPRGRLDAPGAATATLGLMALVYGLSRGERAGFGDGTTLALLCCSAALLAAFVLVELRARDPLVPFEIFRSRTLAGANLATLLFSAVVIGANFFPTLHLQQVLSFSPLRTGLAFLPMTVVAALASTLAAGLVERVGGQAAAPLGHALARRGLSAARPRLAGRGVPRRRAAGDDARCRGHGGGFHGRDLGRDLRGRGGTAGGGLRDPDHGPPSRGRCCSSGRPYTPSGPLHTWLLRPTSDCGPGSGLPARGPLRPHRLRSE